MGTAVGLVGEGVGFVVGGDVGIRLGSADGKKLGVGVGAGGSANLVVFVGKVTTYPPPLSKP